MGNEIIKNVDLGWDPYRTLFGLGRIGYTPPAAIGDILDNSVRAEANNITIIVVKKDKEGLNSRLNNVQEYIIIDDGSGMDSNEMLNALKLGSPATDYEENSLSKFGIGLKSAAFSQGGRLELISSKGNNEFTKYTISIEDIRSSGVYRATNMVLSEEDKILISEHLHKGHGTIVRISDISASNHPSIRDTLHELKHRLGVTYYYFIKEYNLNIKVIIGEEVINIEAYDVLFTEEADENGNLDENEWNGKDVRWIKKSNESIIIDSDYNVGAIIEVTQLPHPPTFRQDRNKIARQYNIAAGNYGYYVYRNKRLISWAERFGKIIPFNQDYYSFRGRILIDDNADEAFNIDVKKSSIVLSDEAANIIDDLSADYKRKSRLAWERAKRLLSSEDGKDSNVTSNIIARDITEPVFPEELSEEDGRKEKERRAELSRKMTDTIKKLAAVEKGEKEGVDVNDVDLSKEEIEETLKGTTNPDVNKIFRVSSIADNMMWEPYYDAEHGNCVRINKNHRFSKLIFEDNYENSSLQILYELFLLNIAQAEAKALTSSQFEDLNTEQTLNRYRNLISDYLTHFCREKGDALPPNNLDI